VRKTLVLGATGFIGNALVKRLVHEGQDVIGIGSECDIAERSCLERFVDTEITNVFHLAAKTFVPESWQDPERFYRTNVMGTVNVLEFCRIHGLPLVYVSAYIYGRPEHLPIGEKDRVLPNNPYAHSKYMAEQLCEFYSREFGVQVLVLRPFNAFGPGQSERFLIPHIIRQALNSDVIRLMSLSPRRDYIYIDDLVTALVASMKVPCSGFEILNIGSGYSLSVREVVDTVLGVIGQEKKVISDEVERKNEIDDVVADISRAQKVLGWQPKTAFSEGISATVQSARSLLHA